MNPLQLGIQRRSFLSRSSVGIGSLALGHYLNQGLLSAKDAPELNDRPWPGVVNPLHATPRAKRVIYLCMAGGPSHLETLDYKPKLADMDGKPMPESVTQGQPIAQLQGQKLKCLGPQHPFQKFGQSGQEICSLFPRIGDVADELCIIRSFHTEQINHDPAHTFINTGSSVSGRPSMGSWLLYGLGSETENLPGFVVLTSVGKGGQAQPISSRQWHSGFLPSNFQGVQFNASGDPVHYVSTPAGVKDSEQRRLVDAINALNREKDSIVDDPEIATRIGQYEMAFRMQASVPELMDLKGEPKHMLDLYGAEAGDGSFASNCLLARRLAERDVRFIQLYHRGWDHHGNVKGNMVTTAKEVDQATAALITDLQQRGMLEDTLIIWGGEFGRTPMAQGSGRDHHIRGFSLFMAGGGIKPGSSYGNTDDLGYRAVDRPFHVHDLHATLLHLLGIDHLKLTYRFQGRDYRLTDIAGHVVKDILS
ncbi:MAG: DUF1501 domain-containing protein [Verrucomicrobiota bacterium]|nr:DUF1501 domain-containing protein [Verrucomicrobiota bacterium]